MQKYLGVPVFFGPPVYSIYCLNEDLKRHIGFYGWIDILNFFIKGDVRTKNKTYVGYTLFITEVKEMDNAQTFRMIRI